MKLTHVVPGDRFSMLVGATGSEIGWAQMEPDVAGLVVSLSADESGGFFVSDVELKKMGYHYRKPRSGVAKNAKGKAKK